ncbi:MAG: hypothetical protein RJA70_957 [Pseudomonadota bacterium]|jgi:glyoxylase-like metal-dependent hydrolase (beta-lactamase superfamily II)/rhodanese-related sulfurtransferase
MRPLIFRQLYDSASSTYTYLLGDPATKEAVLIDPVFEQHRRDAALVRELGLKLVYTLDTHCHADHVTGAWLMKQAYGSQIAVSAAVGADNVDVPLKHGDVVRFGDSWLEVRSTPGHTDGCSCFLSGDRGRVFTGDALLVRGAGRTDFQQGDAHLLYRSIHEQLFSLSDDCLVYPGHDYDGRTASTIGEERAFNPRIGGGAREEDFVGYMQNLGLPHPKQIAVAVPANMLCGQPQGAVQPPAEVSWAPVVTTYAGLPEISADWVARQRNQVHVLDVRSEAEFRGELGHIPDAQLIPLDELRARTQEVPRDKPVIAVCQTGKRAAMATVILAKAGYAQVANLSGGMVAWRDLGL